VVAMGGEKSFTVPTLQEGGPLVTPDPKQRGGIKRNRGRGGEVSKDYLSI